jgi:hypothetical protein
MRKSLLTLGVVAVAILLATSASAGSRGVEFTGIDFHPDDTRPYPLSRAYNMSPDGSIIMVSPDWSNYCFMWTKDGGWGTEVGEAGSLCYVTNDGEVAGDGPNYDIWDYNPGYWLGEPNVWDLIDMSPFDNCGSTLSTHGVSDNQDYLVGLGWEGCSGRRFIHDRTAGTTEVLPCMGEDSCRYNDAADDGNRFVGWNYAQCGRWRGAEEVNGTWDWIDGLGPIVAKACEDTGGECCGDRDCPEWVDDSSCVKDPDICDLTGIECLDNVCTGGVNAGQACSGYWNCPGECSAASANPGTPCTSHYSCEGYCVGGANDGDTCTSDYYCPDTPKCLDNPEFDPTILEVSKGEGYKVSPDGDYILGFEFGQSPYDWDDPEYDWTLFASAYRGNPDGSFTKIPPPPGAMGDSWTPLDMSDDGNVVVGRYGWWIYSYPVIWSEGTGTLDFQYFLISQGLDELWFWYLASLNDVSADGTVVVGYGSNTFNPRCQSTWGCDEGFVVDLNNVAVCHKVGAHNERTLKINFNSVGEHLGHGDELGSCEFKSSGGNARWAEHRTGRPTQDSNGADSNPMFIGADGLSPMQQSWTPARGSQTERPRLERTRTSSR